MDLNDDILSGFERGGGIKINSKVYPTYKIPLSYLWFNDQNGRINTEVAHYKSLYPDFDFEECKRNDLVSYNERFKHFIKESSGDGEKSFYHTKQDIQKKGQEIPGLVLSDGRIVDGNRRFACLLELFNETKDEKFATFEAAVFSAPSGNDIDKWKQIKQIEHTLQFDNDPIRDYSRINLLNSFYTDTLCPKTRLFTKEEYCESTGMKPADYDKDQKIVEIMLDFLKFIKHPGAFWIIKQEKLETTLENIANEKFDLDEWMQMREAIYMHLLTTRNTDVAKNIKGLVDSAKKRTSMYPEYLDQFYEKISPDEIKQVKNIISDKFNNVNSEISSEQDSCLNAIGKKVDNIFNECKMNQEIINLENEPIAMLDRLLKDAVALANNDAIKQMKAMQEEEFKDKLNQLQILIDKIKQNFN